MISHITDLKDITWTDEKKIISGAIYTLNNHWVWYADSIWSDLNIQSILIVRMNECSVITFSSCINEILKVSKSY